MIESKGKKINLFDGLKETHQSYFNFINKFLSLDPNDEKKFNDDINEYFESLSEEELSNLYDFCTNTVNINKLIMNSCEISTLKRSIRKL